MKDMGGKGELVKHYSRWMQYEEVRRDAREYLAAGLQKRKTKVLSRMEKKRTALGVSQKCVCMCMVGGVSVQIKMKGQM